MKHQRTIPTPAVSFDGRFESAARKQFQKLGKDDAARVHGRIVAKNRPMRAAGRRTKLESRTLIAVASLSLINTRSLAGQLSVKDAGAGTSDFPLVVNKQAAQILVDKADADVVRVVADLLAGDTERVSGVKPKVSDAASVPKEPVVILGTLGKSALIDDLVKRGKLDVASVAGQWETFGRSRRDNGRGTSHCREHVAANALDAGAETFIGHLEAIDLPDEPLLVGYGRNVGASRNQAHKWMADS